MSKCHIVTNHMSQYNYNTYSCNLFCTISSSSLSVTVSSSKPVSLSLSARSSTELSSVTLPIYSCKISIYSKCSKISNTFLFLFSNKMLVFRAGIHKFLVRVANREDPDQTASSDCFFRSSLIWVCPVYLGLFGNQLVFDILEHLP